MLVPMHRQHGRLAKYIFLLQCVQLHTTNGLFTAISWKKTSLNNTKHFYSRIIMTKKLIFGFNKAWWGRNMKNQRKQVDIVYMGPSVSISFFPWNDRYQLTLYYELNRLIFFITVIVSQCRTCAIIYPQQQ